MMSKSTWKKVCGFTVVILMGTFISQAQAEGGGKRPLSSQKVPVSWGVNRRVRTTTATGYIEMSGTFSGLGTMKLPEDKSRPDDTRKYTKVSNPCDDKPTAYFGSTGGTGGKEVDAGLQYEWNRVVIGAGTSQRTYEPGWSAFIRADAFTNPFLWDKNADQGAGVWNPWRGFAATYTLRYRIWTTATAQARSIACWNKTTGTAQTVSATPKVGAISLQITGTDFPKNGTATNSPPGEFFANPPASAPAATPTPYAERPRVGRPELTYSPKTPTVADRGSALSKPIPDPSGDQTTKVPYPATDVMPLIYPHTVPSTASGTGIMPSGAFSTLAAKHVVGITQANGFRGETDGAYFQVRFTAGKVVKNGATTAIDWTPANAPIEQAGDANTGYDTPLAGADSKDLRWGQPELLTTDTSATITWENGGPFSLPGAKTKAEFSGLSVSNDVARSDSTASRAATDTSTAKSRYVAETTTFNLRNAARPWGFKVEQKSAP